MEIQFNAAKKFPYRKAHNDKKKSFCQLYNVIINAMIQSRKTIGWNIII